MGPSADEVYDLVYGSKDYRQEAAIIQRHIARCCQHAETVLDAACGTGRHIACLTEFYQVDGLDLSERLLAIARHRNPASRFWQGDMHSFDLGKRYDVVMCLFSSIAYANTRERLVQTIKQFKNHLKPGGLMLIEPWFTPENWFPGYLDVIQAENEEMKVSRMSFSESAGKLSVLHFEYLVGTDKGITRFSEKHELGLFRVEEMLNAFQEVNLAVEYDPQGLTGRGLYLARRAN